MKKKVLLTTPDYPPLRGGLSTLTLELEKTLKDCGYDVSVYHWPSFESLRNSTLELGPYALIVNIHFNFALFYPEFRSKMINFIHGSEILMTSPNKLKRLVKKMLKSTYLKAIEESYLNIFISQATFSKCTKTGLVPNYSRDIIFHNCMNMENAKMCTKFIDEEIRLCWIARPVPHKNYQGVVFFAQKLAELSKKKVTLFATSVESETHQHFKIVGLKDVSDSQREEIYQSSHFNLLFSLDHSEKGFFEGFGLTVLEAGKYGTPSIVLATGGLVESVHHDKTGWVLNELNDSEVERWWQQLDANSYLNVANECFRHTVLYHHTDNYQKLFGSLSI